MIIDYATYAYILLSRDDIADLRATRDADELITYLISNPDSNKIIDDMNYYFDDESHSILRTTMIKMILNPVD